MPLPLRQASEATVIDKLVTALSNLSLRNPSVTSDDRISELLAMLASNERQEGHRAIVEALRNMTEAHASEVNAVLTTSQVTTSQLNTAMAERLLELIERQEEARSRQREESAASQASLLGQFIRALEQAQHQARQQQLEASQQQLQLLRASSEQQQQLYLQLQSQSEQQLKAIEASSQQTVLLIRSGTDAHQQQLQLLGQAQVQLMTQLGQAMISASPSPTQQLFLQNNFSTTTSINDNRQVLQQQLHQHLPIAGSATTASASHRPLAVSDQPRIEADSQLSTSVSSTAGRAAPRRLLTLRPDRAKAHIPEKKRGRDDGNEPDQASADNDETPP